MFSFLVLLVISILPVYLVGLYIYKKDDQKEPPKLLRKLFFFGMLICIPAAILEVILEPLFGAEEYRSLFSWFLYASCCIALVEELFKWLVVYNVGYRHKEFDQVYDAIVYAVFVSLGFACFENIFYVLSSGLTVGIIRALTAIPGHAADAIIMGDYIGLAKIADINHNEKLFKKNIILSILVPTLAHAIYDYCLMTESYFFVGVFIIFLIFIYVYSIKKIKRVASMRKSLYVNDVNTDSIINNNSIITNDIVNFCPNCGTKSHGNFCTVCGTILNVNNFKANTSKISDNNTIPIDVNIRNDQVTNSGVVETIPTPVNNINIDNNTNLNEDNNLTQQM